MVTISSGSFADGYLLNCYCHMTTTADHTSLLNIDSPNLPIPSFLLAFAVSCLRRERDDKEREDLYSSTDKNKETIIINTNETSNQKKAPTLMLSVWSFIVILLNCNISVMYFITP